jgi:hypothetical protein
MQGGVLRPDPVSLETTARAGNTSIPLNPAAAPNPPPSPVGRGRFGPGVMLHRCGSARAAYLFRSTLRMQEKPAAGCEAPLFPGTQCRKCSTQQRQKP